MYSYYACQLVEKKHKKWTLNHAQGEVEFESRRQTAEGDQRRGTKFRKCEQSILLEITVTGKKESKEWDITPKNSLEVKENLYTHCHFKCHCTS